MQVQQLNNRVTFNNASHYWATNPNLTLSSVTVNNKLRKIHLQHMIAHSTVGSEHGD